MQRNVPVFAKLDTSTAMFKSKLFLAAALMLVSSSLIAEEIRWQTDLNSAVALAVQQRKPLMLHCWFEGCGPCKRLETYVFPNDRLAKAINANVIPVKVDVKVQREIAARYGIKSVPQDVFLSPTGLVLLKRQSPSEIDDYVKLVEGINKLNQSQDMLLTGGLNQASAENEISDFNRDIQRQSYEADQQVAGQASKIGEQTNNFVDQFNGNVTDTAQLVQKSAKDRYDTSSRFLPQGAYANQPQTSPAQEENVLSDKNQKVDAASGEEFSSNPYFSGADRQSFQTSPAPNKAAASQSGSDSNGLVFNPFVNQSNRERPSSQQVKTPAVPEKRDSTPQKLMEGDPAKAALEGFCAVTLKLEKKWSKGDARWGCFHRGRLFLFASPTYQARFLQDPENFAPAMVGYDPVRFAESGELVEGKRQIGVYYPKDEPRIYVFSSEDSKLKFQAAPELFSDKVRLATAQCDLDGSVR
jgi:thioredoxin-related protein/YHS domain-containing protein